MRASQSGQVSIFVLGIALISFAVAGVAIDGTRAFLYRRTLQNAADAAALAGASEINASAYYSRRSTAVTLEAHRARTAALEWLARRGLDVRASVTAQATLVSVGLRGRLGTTFLGLVGVESLPVAADATAEPVARSP
jgi:uncharacterized membrane protein